MPCKDQRDMRKLKRPSKWYSASSTIESSASAPPVECQKLVHVLALLGISLLMQCKPHPELPCIAAQDTLSRGFPPRSPRDTPWARSLWRSWARWSRGPLASGRRPIHVMHNHTSIIAKFRISQSFLLKYRLTQSHVRS